MNKRNIGKHWENVTARRLRHIWPDIKRNHQEQASDGGVDLVNTGCFNIEVKKQKKDIKKLRGWMEQLAGEGKPENYDLLVYYSNNQPALAVMPFDDLIELLEKMKHEGIL